MHFVDNLVPLSSQIADDETTEHFISLLGFSDHNTLLGLEDFLVLGQQRALLSVANLRLSQLAAHWSCSIQRLIHL
jgi:hypothetical protein